MKNFDNDIKTLAHNTGLAPIFDGIVSEKDYLIANYKILWVLKEANSTGEDDAWDLREHIREKLKTDNGIAKGWSATFKKIVYVTNGIINGLEWNDELKHPGYDPNVIDELRKIAFINVNKTGGTSRANKNDLKTSYNNSKTLLMNQIKEFKPDILIFGGTFHLFKNDLRLGSMKSYGSCDAIANDGQIYIDAYHPAYPFSEERYFKDIMSALKTERAIESAVSTFDISQPKFQLYYKRLSHNNLLKIMRNDDVANALAYMVDFKEHHDFNIIPHKHCIEIANKDITIALVLFIGFQNEEYRFLQFRDNLHIVTLSEILTYYKEFKELNVKFIDHMSLMFTIMARTDDYYGRMLQTLKEYGNRIS